jgi:hypothetical protein
VYHQEPRFYLFPKRWKLKHDMPAPEIYRPNETNSNSSIPGVSKDDQALLEFGKQQFLNSLETIKNFSQTMITLNSGLFAVYFALLAFLGIKDVNATDIQSIISYTAVPPLLFILSLVAFILAILPLFMDGISVSSPSDISRIRSKAITIKYSACFTGTVFLVSALGVTIYIYQRILGSQIP